MATKTSGKSTKIRQLKGGVPPPPSSPIMAQLREARELSNSLSPVAAELPTTQPTGSQEILYDCLTIDEDNLLEFIERSPPQSVLIYIGSIFDLNQDELKLLNFNHWFAEKCSINESGVGKFDKDAFFTQQNAILELISSKKFIERIKTTATEKYPAGPINTFIIGRFVDYFLKDYFKNLITESSQKADLEFKRLKRGINLNEMKVRSIFTKEHKIAFENVKDLIGCTWVPGSQAELNFWKLSFNLYFNYVKVILKKFGFPATFSVSIPQLNGRGTFPIIPDKEKRSEFMGGISSARTDDVISHFPTDASQALSNSSSSNVIQFRQKASAAAAATSQFYSNSSTIVVPDKKTQHQNNQAITNNKKRKSPPQIKSVQEILDNRPTKRTKKGGLISADKILTPDEDMKALDSGDYGFNPTILDDDSEFNDYFV